MFITTTDDHIYELGIDIHNRNNNFRDDRFNIAAYDNDARGIAFSNDGLKMFVAGNENKQIIEFTLHDPFVLNGTAIRDAGPPTFSSISISPTSGNTAKIGDTITITVQVDHDEEGLVSAYPPTINGQPAIFTEVGSGNYTFSSVVASGDGDVLDTAQLAVNFTLQDSARNNSTATTFIPINDAPGIDATRPTFTANRIGINIISLTFSEPVITTSTDGRGWSVAGASIINNTANSGITITINTNGLTNTNGTNVVTYSSVAGNVVDLHGNAIADGASVIAADLISPTLVDTRVIDATAIIANFTESITIPTFPTGNTGFTLGGNAPSGTTVNSIMVLSDNTIRLNLAGPLLADSHTNVTLSYTPGTPAITDVNNNVLARFTDRSVTNDIDTTLPTFTAARTGTNTIVLTFSEPVTSSTDSGLIWILSSGVVDSSSTVTNGTTITLGTFETLGLMILILLQLLPIMLKRVISSITVIMKLLMVQLLRPQILFLLVFMAPTLLTLHLLL